MSTQPQSHTSWQACGMGCRPINVPETAAAITSEQL